MAHEEITNGLQAVRSCQAGLTAGHNFVVESGHLAALWIHAAAMLGGMAINVGLRNVR